MRPSPPLLLTLTMLCLPLFAFGQERCDEEATASGVPATSITSPGRSAAIAASIW